MRERSWPVLVLHPTPSRVATTPLHTPPRIKHGALRICIQFVLYKGRLFRWWGSRNTLSRTPQLCSYFTRVGLFVVIINPVITTLSLSHSPTYTHVHIHTHTHTDISFIPRSCVYTYVYMFTCTFDFYMAVPHQPNPGCVHLHTRAHTHTFLATSRHVTIIVK